MTIITAFQWRRILPAISIGAIAVLVIASQAWGQASSGAEWRRGTTLGGFAGVSTADRTSLALGTSLGWELNRHLTIEGRGMWLPNQPASSDFYAWLGAIVPFRPGAFVEPFASAGVGMYHADVDAAAGEVPAFYQGRMDGRQRATFDDFALGFGGGANMFVTSHFAIRPEVMFMLVTTRSDARTVPVFGVNVAYHFESHKIR
jgi:opacity protein-like surface antigen